MSAMKLINKIVRHPLPEEEEDRIMESLITSHQDALLKEKWKGIIDNDVINQVKGRNRNLFRLNTILSIAASLIFVSAIGFYMFSDQDSHHDLFDDMIVESQVYHPGNTKGNTSLTTRDEAIVAFNRKDYSASLTLFQKVDAPTQEDKLYQALSSLYLGEAEKCLEVLSSMNAESTYRQEINWNKALAYGLIGKLESARSILLEINPGDYRYAESQALLSDLK